MNADILWTYDVRNWAVCTSVDITRTSITVTYADTHVLHDDGMCCVHMAIEITKYDITIRTNYTFPDTSLKPESYCYIVNYARKHAHSGDSSEDDVFPEATAWAMVRERFIKLRTFEI